MKRILFLVLVFVCFKSYGQLQRPNTRGYQLRNVIVDSFFAPPSDTFSVPNDLRNFPFLATKGTSLYKWNTSSFVWQSISGGGGSSGWSLTGNTGTNPSSNWIGTNTDEVAASLLFKVGGQYAGYIRRTFSNDSTSPVAPSHGFTTYGQYAGKSILDRVIATPADSSLLLLNQTLIGYQTGRRIGVILPSDRAGATPSDENLFVGNSVGRMTRVSSGIYGKGRNTIVSSGFGFYRNLSGSYNAGLGQFVLELNNAGNGNSAFGDGSLRSNIDGDFNASFGGSGMLYNSTGVYSVTVVSGGSGYTVGDTVIFSSPLSNGPGTYYATATGRVSAVDGGGAITSVQVLTPGGGYVSRGDSCFYVGTCHPAVTATAGGSGTGASLVPVLRSGSYNTGSGISNGANNILSQYMTYFGYNAGNVGSYRYWDNYGIAIGPYSGVHTSIASATAVDNWIAFGRNARVSESNTAALGDSATYNYKWVINGTVGDSALKVNNGFHVTRGVRFSGLPQTISPTLYHFLPKYTDDGTVTKSIMTEVLNIVGSGAGIYIDDVTAGLTTTNHNKLYIRNSYDGDGTANAFSQMAQRISGSSSTQKYFLSQLAANIPDGTSLTNYIGKNTSTKNSYLQTFYYAGNGSNGNYMVDQFVGVSNVMRRYASGNVTIGVAADNGYRLEVGGKTRITDSLWGQGGVRFSGLASSSNATDSMMVVDASTGNVGYRAIPSGGSYTASNGLTLSGSNFKLGGALGENTQIALDGFDLIVPDFDNFADTTNWKPVVINTTGSGASVGTLRKATYWPGGGGSSGITVGTTTITSGTSGRIAYNNGGVYGETAGITYQSGASPNLLIQAQNSTYTSLVVKGAASQSANIQEWQNSSGTVIGRFESGGRFGFSDYIQAIGTDVLFGNILGTGYAVVNSSQSYGVKFRDNGGRVPFSFEFGNGTNQRLELIDSRFEPDQGADVASAANLTLGGDGNVFEITGTTTINLISNTGWKNGSEVTLTFSSSVTVTNNAGTSGSNINILLAGGANFSATADDMLTLVLCEVGGVQAWREKSRSVN